MSNSRTLQAFYAFVALRWLRLTGALWILYLLHVGWSLWQVGIAEAAFHAVSFAASVPTGIFADRVGRHRSLLLGLLIGAVAPPMEYLLAPHGVALGALAIGFGALGWSFIDGADQALLHDLSRGLPEGSRAFARLYGRMDAISLLSGAAAAPLGGWLVLSYGWIYPYACQAALTLLAIAPLLMLPAGPARLSGPGQPGGSGPERRATSLRLAYAELRSTPGLLGLVLFGASLGVVATSNHLYAQSSLVAKGETVLAATAVIGLSSLLAALSSALAHRLPARRPASLLRAGSLALAILIAAVGPARGPAAPLAYAGSDAVEGGVDVLYAAELHRTVPDALRATMVSVPQALFSLGMIAIFPLAGWAMGSLGVSRVYPALGLLLAFATLFTLQEARPAAKSGHDRRPLP